MKKQIKKWASNYEIRPATNVPIKKRVHRIQKQRKHIYILILIGVVVLFTFFYQLMKPYLFIPNLTVSQIENLELDGYDNLMIVAHPDDEYLWGGAHLINDNYLVVCITHGNDPVRSSEFNKMIAETNDVGIILSYPDKIAGKRSTWLLHKKSIQKDIQTLINYKKWNTIVTHNVDGEYGHNQHILTHEIVNNAYSKTGSSSDLYYFGSYYSKKKLPGDLQSIDESLFFKKEELSGIYKSQYCTIQRFSHMLQYENWTKAE